MTQNSTKTDALSDVLRGLRATGSVYFCDSLSPPWELVHTEESRAIFHLVRRGSCWMQVDGQRALLGPGDLLFVSPHIDHTLNSVDDDSGDTMLLCGYCQFDSYNDELLLLGLPRSVLLPHDDLVNWPWMLRTLDHLVAEFLSEEPGSELTINKLTEVLLVQLLRADFGRSDNVGLLAALRDKRLMMALSAIHDAPQYDWTLEDAAEQASMSRSGFARKFKDVMDVSFFDYLTRLRMRNARELLSSTHLPVADIGLQVGYQSELSFVKTFKKLHNLTPRAWRQQQP